MSIIKILALLAAIRTAQGYVTEGGTATASSVDNSSPSNAIDNNSTTYYESYPNLNPWLQIQLQKNYTIATVYFNPKEVDTLSSPISIYVGNDSLLEQNKVCRSHLYKEGMYTCDAALTGNRLGVRKEGTNISRLLVYEIRGYEMKPFTIIESMLSDTSAITNNSLHVSLTLGTNFSTSENGIWQVNFGISKKIKAVLVKSKEKNWSVKVGNNAVASQNSNIYNTTSEFTKEVLVESEGQYLSIISSGSLYLHYVAIFEQPACNLNCSVSFPANQVYYLGQQANLTIPPCGGNSTTTQATLTPNLLATPLNFANVTKNADNSFNIAFNSSYTSLAGQTLAFTLAISDSSAPSSCQYTTTLNVEVKNKNVDCSALTVSNINYFISEITELTIPACVVTSEILPDTIVGTLTSSGNTDPPSGFATITKNTNGSFKIVLNSSDVSKTGQSYQFTFGFSDSSILSDSLIQPNAPLFTFTVNVKCAKKVEFKPSNETQHNLNYFISERKEFFIPACVVTPEICADTIKGTLISTGSTTPPENFAKTTKNTDGSYKIELYLDDVSKTGQSYKGTFGFIDSSNTTSTLTLVKNQVGNYVYSQQLQPNSTSQEQPSEGEALALSFSVQVKCAKLVDCSNSVLSDVIVFNGQPKMLTIPMCQITPSICADTIIGTLTSIPMAPQGFATMEKTTQNFFNILLSSSDMTIHQGQVYQFNTTFKASDAELFTQPSKSQFNVTFCQLTHLVAAAQIPNQDYVLGQKKILIPIPNLTQTPACGDLVSYTLSSVPSFIQVEGTNIALFGSDLTQAGTFNVVLTATERRSGTTIQLRFSVIAHNCTPVGFAATPSTLAIPITKIQVPAAILLSQTAGPSQCGPYSFNISPDYDFVVFDKNKATITVSPTPSTEVNTYKVTATSMMIDAPYLTATLTIPVTITCSVESVHLISTEKIADQSFEISLDAEQIQIKLPTYKSLPCLKPIKRTVVVVETEPDLPTPITYSDTEGTIYVQINDPSKTGSYTLQVIATEAVSGKQNLEVTFKVTLTCTVTKFSNQIKNVENLEYLVGQPSTSPTQVKMLLPSYETTPSYCYLSPCKLELKLLDPKGTKALPLPSFISQTEDEIQIETNDPSQIGEYNFNLVATEQAGLIDSSVNFKAKIKCQIQNLRPFVIPATVQNLVYELGGPSVKFTMPTYVWEPMACKRVITYSIENLTMGAASVSVLPEFMKFNAETNVVTLNGSLFKESGKSYLFKLVAFNAEDQQSNRDYSFTINTTFKNKPPVFTQALTNQFLTVGMDTSWSLPKLQDPENHEISIISVKIGKYTSWLQFDPSEMMFTVTGQNLNNSDPVYLVIPIVVSDIYGATNEYDQKIFIQQSKEVTTDADDSLLANSTSNATLDEPEGGNQTLNNSMTSTLSQNETVQVVQPEDLNSEPPLPSTEDLVNLAANLTLGQEATQELASAIFKFPQLQNYFANLLAGRPMSSSRQQNKIVDQIKEVKPKKEIPLQIDVTGISAMGQVIINSNQPIEVRVTDGKLPSFLFKAEFVGSEGSTPQTMDYEVTSFNETQIVIQLKFDNPKAIGQGFSQDMVSFKLLKDFFAKLPSEEIEQRRRLQANESHTPNMSYISLASQVPQQMNATSPETISIVSTAAQAKFAMNSTFFFTFILQFLARGVMKGVWPLYSTLQILSVFLLYMVKVPSNVIVLSEQYNKIINMEFIPKEQIFEFVFKKNPELLAVIMKTGNSTMSDYATKSMGVGNPNMTVNICLMVGIGIAVVGSIIVLLILIRYASKKYPKVNAELQNIKHMLMFNSILRSLLQSYLQLCINTLLVFKLAKKGAGNDGNKFITVLTLLVLLAFPVFIFMFLKRMANWRKDFTLKDQYHLFCKSRNARRAYEIKKIEDKVKQEEQEEANQLQTELVLGNDIESCRQKAQVIQKRFGRKIKQQTQIPTESNDWMRVYVKNAKLQVFPIEAESIAQVQAEPEIFDPLSLERNLLARKDVQRSFSTLYLNLDIYRETVAFYTVSLLVRRFMLAFVIAAFDFSFFQIWMTILISIAQIFYLSLTRPKEKPLDNFVIIANEMFIYACAVNLLLFTEYVEDANKRWSCGYSFMFCVLACVVVNVGIAIFVELKIVIETLKVKYAAWKAKKQEAKDKQDNEEEAEADPKQQIPQLNPNFESSSDNLEDKDHDIVRDFGRKNVIRMPDLSNEISHEEDANFEDNSCVPEEMKDPFYKQEGELVDKIAGLEEDDQDATVIMEAMKQIEEEKEDGEEQICTLSVPKSDPEDQKHNTYAKVHPVPETNSYFFDFTD